MSCRRLAVGAFLIVPLSGCGLYTPDLHDFYQPKSYQREFESIIINNVKCELHVAVQDTLENLSKGYHKDVSWLGRWGAKVNMRLSIEEKSSLGPGVSLEKTFENVALQSFTLGLGGSGTAGATREETIEFTYAFSDLLAERRETDCSRKEKGLQIESDLKIRDFIYNKMFIAALPGTVDSPKPKASPYSVFSYHVTFVQNYSGDVTPTWKFLRVTVNPDSPLFHAERNRTNDLTITLGETAPATKFKPAVLSFDAQLVHNSILIGQQVGTAVQSQAAGRVR
jgi:predicted transport protein